MIERLFDPVRAEAWCRAARAAGHTLGFVPTMGALHEGHLALVQRAARENDRVVVSVFVNPLQFDERKDFERYPRDFEGDALRLDAGGAQLVFTGSLAQFFPGSGGRMERIALRDPGPRAEGLEGEHRPGHFAGVATIVARLFELVGPERAYFGAKDFQQTLVVRDLVPPGGRPEIVVCPTVREPSGLARSSRNELLDPAARERATALHRALLAARRAWRDDQLRDTRGLGQVMRAALADSGLELEYAEVRDPQRWAADGGTVERGVALIAARLAGVRLIDNLRLDGEES